MRTHESDTDDLLPPFWGTGRVVACVPVYVCLYAEWIKKLLINLIKSKSCVNIAGQSNQGVELLGPFGARSREQGERIKERGREAQKDSYKFLKENK